MTTSIKLTAAEYAANKAKYETEYTKQRPIPKKQVLKLRPGAWIEVKWKDAPNQLLLLAERPFYEPGDMRLEAIEPLGRVTITHDQVVAVRGNLAWPSKG